MIAHEQARHGYVRKVAVVAELDLTQQVTTQQDKDHDPKHDKHFAVQQAPSVSQVATERNFSASASSRKPNTTLTEFSQPPDFGMLCSMFGKDGEKAERNRQ